MKTSQFGTVRVEEDALLYKPDFVIIEFSVNDDNTKLYQKTYEGLVRRVYGMGRRPLYSSIQWHIT